MIAYDCHVGAFLDSSNSLEISLHYFSSHINNFLSYQFPKQFGIFIWNYCSNELTKMENHPLHHKTLEIKKFSTHCEKMC